MGSYKLRRLVAVIILLLLAAVPLSEVPFDFPTLQQIIEASEPDVPSDARLAGLDVKGRAPKTGYERSEFGNGWERIGDCDTRNLILARDMQNETTDDGCKVQTGSLQDPYTGSVISFLRGETTSDDVQIDHVVALSNAWQTGAQQLTYADRVRFANDPLNLLAVDGATNEAKSDSDAASWLPPNKAFRCQYVTRQISVKSKYGLWVTAAEKDAMNRVLNTCEI